MISPPLSDGLRQRAAIAADDRGRLFHSRSWLWQKLWSAPAWQMPSGGAAVSTSGASALMVAPALSRSALAADYLQKQSNYRLPSLVMKSITNTRMPKW
jgi:hypothetical protein